MTVVTTNICAALAIAASMAGAAATTIVNAPYGTTQGGQAVDIYTMTNDHGMRVRFLSYGGVITEIDVPDRVGRLDDIVLGLRTCASTRRSARITAPSPAATPIASAVHNSR